MSWMEKLYQTYEHTGKLDEPKPWPISHFVKTAHIEIVLDSEGNLKPERIKLLSGEEASTLIPAAEGSAGRAGAKIAPHPLSDEIGYCASDYPEIEQERFKTYIEQLKEWCLSDYSHPKIRAIYAYLTKNTLWRDLIQTIEFPITFTNKRGQKTKITADKAFIRWRVEELGNPCSGTWEDDELIHNWIAFDRQNNSNQELCFITGVEGRLIQNHSKFIRHSSDGAKLVSSNDSSGYTYRGRFLDETQACSIGFDVSQKAHNALRWLISRQGFRNGDQVYVAWAVSGQGIPEPLKDSYSYLENLDDDDYELEVVEENTAISAESTQDHTIDLGESYAKKLKVYMAGYAAKLSPNEQIIIMGLDSATPGRMGILYYREMFSGEFLARLETWHKDFAWPQRHTQEIPADSGKKPKTKVIYPISSPIPRDIAKAAYGDNVGDDLKKKVIERLMPCIVDGYPFPFDIVQSCLHKATNRVAYANDEQWLWEKNLGVTCALYKGYYARHPKPNQRRIHTMALDENYHARDYLYGRLLAVAERIEEAALGISGEKRSTTAARLMQRFADRPFETWRTIELALQPYMQRLQAASGWQPGFLNNRLKDIDVIMSLFNQNDFNRQGALTGEFLLGYHCQRQKYKTKTENTEETTSQGDIE